MYNIVKFVLAFLWANYRVVPAQAITTAPADTKRKCKEQRRIRRAQKKWLTPKKRKHEDEVCAMLHFLNQFSDQLHKAEKNLPHTKFDRLIPIKQSYVLMHSISKDIRKEVERKRVQLVKDRQYRDWSIEDEFNWTNAEPPCSISYRFLLENFQYGGNGFGDTFYFGKCANETCQVPLPVDRGCPECMRERLEDRPQMLLRATHCDSAVHIARLIGSTYCRNCVWQPGPVFELRVEYWEPSPYQAERKMIEELAIREFYNEELDSSEEGDNEMKEENEEGDNGMKEELKEENEENKIPFHRRIRALWRARREIGFTGVVRGIVVALRKSLCWYRNNQVRPIN